MLETQVWSLGPGDPLEKEMATHSSTLAWKIPWRSLVGYSPWGCKELDMTVTSLSFFLSMTQNPWASNSTSCAILLLLFSCQVMSDSLRLHGLQHTRLPCPSPSLGVCPCSCPLNGWCHPTILSSLALFSFCLQSFPASGSFLMCQLFASGGQSIGASASASVLPKSIQGWFPLRLTALIY